MFKEGNIHAMQIQYSASSGEVSRMVDYMPDIFGKIWHTVFIIIKLHVPIFTGSAFQYWPYLRKLDLSCNKAAGGGFGESAACLTSFKQLQLLDIHQCCLSEDDVAALSNIFFFFKKRVDPPQIEVPHLGGYYSFSHTQIYLVTASTRSVFEFVVMPPSFGHSNKSYEHRGFSSLRSSVCCKLLQNISKEFSKPSVTFSEGESVTSLWTFMYLHILVGSTCALRQARTNLSSCSLCGAIHPFKVHGRSSSAA